MSQPTEKEKLGENIRVLRKLQGITTYQLEKAGFHPTIPNTIELGQKGYTIDTLLAYLKANNLEITIQLHEKK